MAVARKLTAASMTFATMLAIVACGSSSSSAAARGKGPVNVLYAGSLTTLMNGSLGAAFDRATGYTFDGFPAGSSDLANEIKSGVRQGDVFLSASPSVNATLKGSKNGEWVTWYAPFATTRLVLAYNPHSSFARALRTEPWYRVITRPGFRLGFTDPKLDPKGVLTTRALDQAATAYHVSALTRIAADQSDVFPEQDLVGRLQSGQLDAGFFYTVEASAAKIPTVSLDPIDLQATYTITILARARHPAAAESFVKFLLGPQGQKLLRSVGLKTISAPTVIGDQVPAGLGPALGRS
ncbi:MAG: extracellular solute-binding protein [Solirubrobacteraceae bacterium]